MDHFEQLIFFSIFLFQGHVKKDVYTKPDSIGIARANKQSDLLIG